MNSDKKIIIAIDGYSSSGKSTMARKLAATIGYRYIDSGAMYRAVTLWAMRHGLIGADLQPDTEALAARLGEIHVDFHVNPDGSQNTLLNGEDVEREIRTLEVSERVSPVAAIGAVRRALTAMQRRMGEERGIVMDGRDIGTAVFPDAELKVFVDASAECRAKRRFKELTEKGENVTYEEVLNNVRTRDHIDETREESPLRRAEDAVILDNSAMTTADQDEIMMGLYNNAIANA
ncbi:MAG: (d)CMP kinase [Duncaniella sp.]|nr:(d)CMP kinase [Duncaniella sp.]